MEQRVGWGVLGCAEVARRHFLPALAASANACLVAVGARDPARAAAAVAAAGAGRAAASYADVLEDPAVDAVYVPLPNALHREWVLASLRAGKHVLCEKPLALATDEVDQVARAARTAGRLVMEGFMYRFHPQHASPAWERLLGEIGDVRGVHLRMSRPMGRPHDIRRNSALGGGALWDIGCYCLDWLTWRFGDIVQAHAIGDEREGCDWTAAVQLRFGSGALGTVWWAFGAAPSQSITMVGERGVAELTTPFQGSGSASHRLRVGRSGEVQELRLPAADCYLLQLEHFGRALAGTEAPAVALSDTRRWVGLAEEIRRQIGRTSQGPAAPNTRS